MKLDLDLIEDLSYAQIQQMVQDREFVLIKACKSGRWTKDWVGY